MMRDLIIWRHAVAEEHSKDEIDLHRALTKRGHKAAYKMARWLNERLPEESLVLSSPARRCLETADALNKGLKKSRRHVIEIADYLGADSSVAAMLNPLSNLAGQQHVVLVGHQPLLGNLIAELLNMRVSACVVKKGAVWWLRQKVLDGREQYYLHTVQNPNDL